MTEFCTAHCLLLIIEGQFCNAVGVRATARARFVTAERPLGNANDLILRTHALGQTARGVRLIAVALLLTAHNQGFPAHDTHAGVRREFGMAPKRPVKA